MIAILKQRKSKSSQYRFLWSHRRQLLQWLGIDRIPCRSTYFDRYRRAWKLYEQAIRIEGARAVRHGLTNPRCISVDQSVIKAQGPRWNKRQVARGSIPKEADLDAAWTYSSYHGWVLGYGYEVVVSSKKNGTVWPLLASVDPASYQPKRTFSQKINHLPRKTRYVLADAGYDSNEFGESIEYDASDQRTGRRFLCPQIYRRGEHRRPETPRQEKGARRRKRQRRDTRQEFFERPFAQRLFTTSWSHGRTFQRLVENTVRFTQPRVASRIRQQPHATAGSNLQRSTPAPI